MTQQKATTRNERTDAYGDLLVVSHDYVSLVRMNRPDKLNAMGRAFWADLRTVLDQLQQDEHTRVIVITGAGDKSFSVGGDIASFTHLKTIDDRHSYLADTMRTFAALEDSPVPIIAAVNGWALGGGCELTLACDIVIASDQAVFGMPEAALGLVPGFGVLRAPSVIGRQMTKLMVMAGARLDAHEALQAGLVQRVVAHADLMSAAFGLAKDIAANSPFAHAVGKRMINRGVDRAEFDYSVEALTVLQSTQDTAEGIDAFLEKRKPRFKTRSS